MFVQTNYDEFIVFALSVLMAESCSDWNSFVPKHVARASAPKTTYRRGHQNAILHARLDRKSVV